MDRVRRDKIGSNLLLWEVWQTKSMLCPHSLRSFFLFPLVICFPSQQPASASLLEDHPQAAQVHLPAALCKPDAPGKNSLPLTVRLQELLCTWWGQRQCIFYTSSSHTVRLSWIGWGLNHVQILMQEVFESPVLISSQAMPRLPSNGFHFRQQGSLFRAPYRI